MLLREVAGVSVESWLAIELPRVQSLRVDLLFRATAGHLVQLEFQSHNDATMALRMAEYSRGVYRQHGEFPQQLVLYVGREPVQMESRLEGRGFSFGYELVDMRELDGRVLLESAETSDNVLGILTRLADRGKTVEHILERITTEWDGDSRAFYLEALLVLAGLRGLEKIVEEEARKMPVLNDILDNQVLGREYKRGLAEGEQRGERIGERRGQQRGEQKGKLALLQRMIEKRFGPVPEWVKERLASLSDEGLEKVSDRLFGAETLEELLADPS